MTTTSNQKYEITEISHEKYPFLHRIRALRDVSAEVSAGDLGGFVESESNLSFEPDDTAWIFDDAIACNDAYVDKGAVLRGETVVCDNAYISMGAVLSGHARVEDNRNPVIQNNGCPRDSVLSLGLRFFYPTFSNGITLHRFSSGGSGGSGVLAAVTDSMKPPIFSAAPLCISLVMCV